MRVIAGKSFCRAIRLAGIRGAVPCVSVCVCVMTIFIAGMGKYSKINHRPGSSFPPLYGFDLAYISPHGVESEILALHVLDCICKDDEAIYTCLWLLLIRLSSSSSRVLYLLDSWTQAQTGNADWYKSQVIPRQCLGTWRWWTTKADEQGRSWSQCEPFMFCVVDYLILWIFPLFALWVL